MKRCFPLPAFYLWPCSAASAWQAGSKAGSRNTEIFSLPAKPSESGYLLLLLLPLLTLSLAFLLGTIKVVQLSQQRIAMQARLDICSLDLLLERRRLVEELTTGNRIIRLSALAVSMSRGLKILAGPAGVLVGTLGEAGLIKLNRTTAAIQSARVQWFQARELLKHRCGPTPFSKEPALCRGSPPLHSALIREKTLFPDLQGALVFRKGPIFLVKCSSGKGITSARRLEGDLKLIVNEFSDSYEP